MIQIIINFKLASNFNFLNNANNQFLIGKSSDGASKSITGQILELSYSCRTFNYQHIENYKILPSLREGLVKSGYLFDETKVDYDNMMAQSRSGNTVGGPTYKVDPKDPILIDDGSRKYLRITADNYWQERSTYYGYTSADVMRVYTAVIRIQVSEFPHQGYLRSLLKFDIDKDIVLKISDAGNLVIDGQTRKISDKNMKLNLGTWYIIKATLTRFVSQQAFHDCSFGVEVLGMGEFGGDLECKQFSTCFNFLGRNIEIDVDRGVNYLRYTLGGDLQAGEPNNIKFEASYLFVFKGPIELMDTSSETNCEGGSNDLCKLYASGTNAKVCLTCPDSGGAKWMFDPRTPATRSVKCEATSTDLALKPDSFYYPNVYWDC